MKSATLIVLLATLSLIYGECIEPTITQVLQSQWTTDGMQYSLYQVEIHNVGTLAIRYLDVHLDRTLISDLWELEYVQTTGMYQLPAWRAFEGIPAGASHSFGYIATSSVALWITFEDFSCTPHGEECVCPEIYVPVCGNNGKNYSNECKMTCEGASKAHDGECAYEECVCAQLYQPVCGSDGKTYSNLCKLNCDGATLVHDGECTQSEASESGESSESSESGESSESSESSEGSEGSEECMCTMEYAPVCGLNGKGYNNECQMRCDGATKAHDGECTKDDCMCASQYAPVCGTNAVTYSSSCWQECDGATLAHNGECTPQDCMCSLEYQPVCATNGKKYNNICQMKCDGAKLLHTGEC